MARPPSPWYWKARGGWYTTIDGGRELLATGPKKATEADARKAFHRLMATRGQRRSENPLLGVLVAAYLDDLRARRDRGELADRVPSDYSGRIAAFAKAHALEPADRITTAMVDDFLASRTDWGANRRTDFWSTLRAAYRWAKGRGMVSCDPPRPSRVPGRKLKRDKIPDRAEVDAILAAIGSPRFLDFARFVALTGCRPSEAAALEARHLADGEAVLDEHKTRRKTGAVRAIVLNGPASAILARLAEAHPEGPLFRNDRGRSWNRSGWGQAFDRARDAAKADEKITLYSFRHARATELLVAGVDLATVAALLGNDPAVTGRTYSDVVARREHLRKAAERGMGEGA